MTAVGDVNGDGFTDIAIGTPADSAVCYMCGAIYLGPLTIQLVQICFLVRERERAARVGGGVKEGYRLTCNGVRSSLLWWLEFSFR